MIACRFTNYCAQSSSLKGSAAAGTAYHPYFFFLLRRVMVLFALSLTGINKVDTIIMHSNSLRSPYN